jgi:hypothetical protein
LKGKPAVNSLAAKINRLIGKRPQKLLAVRGIRPVDLAEAGGVT